MARKSPISERERETLKTKGPIWGNIKEARGPDECQSSRANGPGEEIVLDIRAGEEMI